MKEPSQPSASRLHHPAPYLNVKPLRAPCLGLCHRYIDATYVLMAWMRPRLRDGLLLTFANTTLQVVDLVWRDYDGDEVPLTRMLPGTTFRFSSTTSHNYCARNSKNGQYYLLDGNTELIGASLRGMKKDHTILIKSPAVPLALSDICFSAVLLCLKEPDGAFRLSVPSCLQSKLNCKKQAMISKRYYSLCGEPGYYKKRYEGKDNGPLVCPAWNWPLSEKNCGH